MMARMGTRFLGVGQGYDANTWVFVPIWKGGGPEQPVDWRAQPALAGAVRQ